MKKKHSTRKAFIGFAMSFLQVGNCRLLRWVLQQREMYFAVLRGLGDDDDETIVYVLSTLRDKILVPASLVPPGLRSVLFGSVTLDKLINISSRCDGDTAVELAHSVLVAVCTDPSNGLMPDLTRDPSPLRGNPKRLLDLMKKLKATKIEYHRDLLLAIVKGRPSLACLYMDEYPYNLEDHTSPSWFTAVSLAADLISSVGSASPFSFIDSLCDCPPSFNGSDVQCVMKCICPRPFTRLVINKGLLHSNSLVKHVTLKLVLEELKLLDSFMSTMESKFSSDGLVKQRCMSLKMDIQNETRTLLPDPQVLLSLLSSLSSHYKSVGSCLKRKRSSKVVLEEGNSVTKKLKTENADEDVDILVSGVGCSPEIALPGDDAVVEEIKNVDNLYNRDRHVNVIVDFWGLHHCSLPALAAEDEETYFYSKLLDTLRFYHLVKKSLKFRGMTHYLVEHHGLISWLSSVVSVFIGIQFKDKRNFPLTMLVTVLEVAYEVIGGDDTIEWLQKVAFEQLTELSTHIYKLLVGGTLIQEHMHIVSSILKKILTSSLKISQKRELYQTHFTMSIEAMFLIYEAVKTCSNTKYSETAELGLTAVLMSAPPVSILFMDEEKLMKFLNWATLTAIQLDSEKSRPDRDNDSLRVICSEEDPSKEDSMISKLLRWLTASVILRRLPKGSLNLISAVERSEPKTLLSLLEHAKAQGQGLPTFGIGCEEILARNILHLQLLGTNYSLLPSVVSALCLLQFPDLSHVAEIGSLPDNQNDLSSLLARIRCPVEANPAWRWSFNQQWEDISSKYTDSEKLDELHACQTILLIMSKFIGNKMSLSHTLSIKDVEKSGVFAWERSILLGK